MVSKVQNEDKQALSDRFSDVVQYLNRRLNGDRVDEWERSALTIPQIKTLLLLQEMGPSRMGVISLHLGRALSATTTVVDRLVARGLVDRGSDPADRRVVICRLSETGEQVTEQFWGIARERLDAVVDLIEVDDLEIAVRGLEILRVVAGVRWLLVEAEVPVRHYRTHAPQRQVQVEQRELSRLRRSVRAAYCLDVAGQVHWWFLLVALSRCFLHIQRRPPLLSRGKHAVKPGIRVTRTAGTRRTRPSPLALTTHTHRLHFLWSRGPLSSYSCAGSSRAVALHVASAGPSQIG